MGLQSRTQFSDYNNNKKEWLTFCKFVSNLAWIFFFLNKGMRCICTNLSGFHFMYLLGEVHFILLKSHITKCALGRFVRSSLSYSQDMTLIFKLTSNPDRWCHKNGHL